MVKRPEVEIKVVGGIGPDQVREVRINGELWSVRGVVWDQQHGSDPQVTLTFIPGSFRIVPL